jgi:hypothetical protein
MTDQQIAELIALRKQDIGIVPLARRFGIGVNKVRDILNAHGITTQTVYQRIAWTIKAHPDWSDELVANHCGCHAAIVEERRPMILKNRKATDLGVGITLNQRLDRGLKFRVCRKWLRANCSRGERNIDQIAAIFGVSNFPITLVEVRASCQAAGLAVDTFGRVTAPANRD